MAEHYIVPNIYQDMSDQSQGYFAFRFACQECGWSVNTTPMRSSVSTATNVMDIGVGLLGGFWGRAAEAGEKIYGSKWHAEQAKALQKAWGEIEHEFHLCPRCKRTVCMRCFNVKLNLCTGSWTGLACAPDLKADGASFQHGLNVQAQRQQLEQNYHAPQFNTAGVPSAVTPDMLAPLKSPPQQQHLPSSMPQPQQQTPPQAPSMASIAGFSTPGYPQEVMCPTCRRMGPPGKFCQDCGTKLAFPDLFCPKCAAPVENSARFCPECGEKLQQAT